MTQKTLTKKEFEELVATIPKPLLEYLKKNSDKPNNELGSYMMGYFQGIKYVIEMIEPHLKAMNETLHQ
jgi:uncharacterized protein (DUF2164 family)